MKRRGAKEGSPSFSQLSELAINYQPISALKPCSQNARTHSKRQIQLIADSIREFGFVNPILIDSANMIVAGHGRYEAAKILRLNRVPTIALENLTPDQLRAYVIADNRLAERAGWDNSILAIELQHLLTLENLDIQITGFEVPEIDLVLGQSDEQKSAAPEVVELESGPPVSRPGDLWMLGRHRLICGSSLDHSTFKTLMDKRTADVVFVDPPYNVPIDGNVCGKGSIRHREFLMACGEMTVEEFSNFLCSSLQLTATFTKPGAVLFVCMDWRHMSEVLEAGRRSIGELLNLCVWVKDNGGMGSFYRSRHELIFVFRKGKQPHRNNIQLGRYGRNRTNVWEFPGVNTLSRNGEEGNLLALHPTVKPTSLVTDALLDCSARGDIVLDSFIGSGTTLIAAERVGRRCYGIEIDPQYVDVAIRRWERYTGQSAIHASGEPFADLEAKARAPSAG